MSAKDLKTLYRRSFEEWNKGKAAAMAVIDKDNATNVVYHRGTGEDIRGLKAVKQFMSEFYDAFPDFHVTIDDIVVEGDKAVVRYSYTGTHKDVLMGIPATNRKVTGWTVQIDRFAGGKVVEAWERFDTLGFMQQLGVVPMPKK
jgi:predicted ester cyclase